MSDLIERLRGFGSAWSGPQRDDVIYEIHSHIHGKHTLLASDLLEAAEALATLEAKLAVAREALEKVAACETSINGHIAREALSAMIAASTPHDDGGE